MPESVSVGSLPICSRISATVDEETAKTKLCPLKFALMGDGDGNRYREGLLCMAWDMWEGRTVELSGESGMSRTPTGDCGLKTK